MKQRKLFITGISTDVGKTIAAAIITEALKADYWKPIQAGELENTDTHKVERLVSNSKSKFHAHSYALKTPMSPHAAAEIDRLSIDMKKIVVPKTKNNLIIEGAGGLLVPLSQSETILDLIAHCGLPVLLVSRHYLGSINHTLLSAEVLRSRGIPAAIIFNGDENIDTEQIILHMSGLPCVGRIDDHPRWTAELTYEYADRLKPALEELVLCLK